MGVLGTAEWIQGQTGTAMGSWRSDRGKADGYMREGGADKEDLGYCKKKNLHCFKICAETCEDCFRTV